MAVLVVAVVVVLVVVVVACELGESNYASITLMLSNISLELS